MKNKILLVIVIILFVEAVISFSNKTNFSLAKTEVEENKDTKIVNENLENYVIGVVACEMPASFNEEALKAQAVAARTNALKFSNYSLDYDWVTNVTTQCYSSLSDMENKWKSNYDHYYNIVKESVYSTSGEVIYYDDYLINAYYFAMSNGYTEDSINVFNESLPYIKVIESPENDSIKNFKYKVSFNLNDFLNKLSIDNFSIKNIVLDESHRVSSITIDNKIFTGIEIRKLLGLRSTDFEIELINGDVVITCSGYGHGVGMSQYGSNVLANDGYLYSDIINYYYSGVDIKNFYV